MKIFFILLLCISIEAFGKDTSAPISIDSDHLEFDQEHNRATFTGNVMVDQDGTKLYADKLIVHYNANNANSSELTNKKVEKIESFGNIKFVSADKTAYSDFAVYNMSKQMLEMQGNVKLEQDKSVLYGEKLIYDMKTKFARLISKKNQGRVRAVINKK
ncbi:MAG: lipopolysaccharide transport periplasmic protein LptA [Alphaproteobacteria bacterium]|nr:lipopolysaccharide transport periplasmic protein LptA [Alphaproteobacteria bacterium]OJV11962.1 MAG: lipopolysaccharide transport periplasmic protein LptA [Alphaproteobacteria bacterium 33-17]